jgi:hypothetical protein
MPLGAAIYAGSRGVSENGRATRAKGRSPTSGIAPPAPLEKHPHPLPVSTEISTCFEDVNRAR